MLKNESFLAIVAVDTAENEPVKVSRKWGVQNGSARGHQVPYDFEKEAHAKTLVPGTRCTAGKGTGRPAEISEVTKELSE